MLKYWLDRYKTQEACDKLVDAGLLVALSRKRYSETLIVLCCLMAT